MDDTVEKQKLLRKTEASFTIRICNYFIDIFIFYILIISFYSLLAILDLANFLFELAENPLKDHLLTIFFYALYLFIIEILLKGKSIGKLITGTKVATEEGEIPSTGTFLKRNFLRLVPFDPISFVGKIGWHDKWSNTRVVKTKMFDEGIISIPSIDDIGNK